MELAETIPREVTDDARVAEKVRRRGASWWLWAWGVAVLWGVGARVRQYWAGDSFFADEANLAVCLRDLSWGQVLGGPLKVFSSTQAGPPGFLVAGKALIGMGVTSEWGLRGLPLGCSVGAFLLLAVLAYRRLGAVWGLLPVGLMAGSKILVLQAATFKQYSGDSLAAAILLCAALWNSEEERWRVMRRVATVGAVLCWGSHAAVIVTGAMLLGLAVSGGPWGRAWRSSILAVGMAAGSFALLYWLNVRVQRDDFLDEFWAKDMAPWARGVGATALWAADRMRGVFGLVGNTLSEPIAVVATLGLFAAIRRYRREETVLLAIGLTAWGLALARVYPFGTSRLSIYLTPEMSLLVGYGARSLWEVVRGLPEVWVVVSRGVMVAGLGVTLAGSAGVSVNRMIQPHSRGEGRAVVERLRREVGPADRVVLASTAAQIFVRWYWPEAMGDGRFAAGPAGPGGVRWWVEGNPEIKVHRAE